MNPLFKLISIEHVIIGSRIAERCSINVKKRGIGLHSLRIAREAAWDAGVNSGDDGSMYATAYTGAERID